VEGVVVEIGVGRVVCVELILCTGYVLYGGVGVIYVVYMYIVGGGVLRIPDIFLIDGFVLNGQPSLFYCSFPNTSSFKVKGKAISVTGGGGS
jgi:hypothetical protein